jgi:hypothetical protein
MIAANNGKEKDNFYYKKSYHYDNSSEKFKINKLDDQQVSREGRRWV